MSKLIKIKTTFYYETMEDMLEAKESLICNKKEIDYGYCNEGYYITVVM